MNYCFLQIHTLTSYSASLLNRDDVGFAKRAPFGGTTRTRISSQCLKRHWRTAEDENALRNIQLENGLVPMSVRSRRTFEKYVFEPLVARGVNPAVAHAATEAILAILLPKGKSQQTESTDTQDEGEKETDLRTPQVTVIGKPEIDYLLSLAERICSAASDESAVRKAAEELDKREQRKNLQTLAHGAGLDASLFGRMTTGDVLSRCDAAIHVAHAFTVHEGQFETDYFSALDDLQGPEETGSGHINTTELSSGLFYGNVVVDVPQLVSNLEGCNRTEWLSADRTLAAEVVRRLVHLIATISPGAKRGSTAPYAHASMVMVEAGSRQPRTLANAFLRAVPLRRAPGRTGDSYDVLQATYTALANHIVEYDRMYGSHEHRHLSAQTAPEELVSVCGGSRMTLAELSEWTAAQAKVSP